MVVPSKIIYYETGLIRFGKMRFQVPVQLVEYFAWMTTNARTMIVKVLQGRRILILIMIMNAGWKNSRY